MPTLPPTFLKTTLFTNKVLGNISVTGDVTSDVIYASNITSRGNVYATNFVGNGAHLSGVVTTNAGANAVLVTDDAGVVMASDATPTDLSYVHGVRGNVQAQIDAKQKSIHDVVNVESMNDFPAPQNGVIHLGNDVSYWISGYIDLYGNSLLCSNNTSIVGINPYGSFLVSDLPTNTALIKSNVNSIVISNMQLRAPNLINYINVYENYPTYGMQIQNCILNAPSRLATVDGINIFEIDSCQTSNSGTIHVNGKSNLIYFKSTTFEGQDNNSIITLGHACNITNRVRILDCSFDVKNTGNVLYVSNTTTFSRPEAVMITDSYATTSNFLAGNMTPMSLYLKSHNNINLQNSQALGHLILNGNITVATPVTGNFYPVDGSWSVGDASTKFISHGNGQITYIGYGIQRFLADVSLTFVSSSNKDTCGFGIFSSSNGNVFPWSVQYQDCPNTTELQNMTTKYLFVANTGDYMQIYGTNRDSAGGFTVTGANFIIQAL